LVGVIWYLAIESLHIRYVFCFLFLGSNRTQSNLT
jgi:hypothetical protein